MMRIVLLKYVMGKYKWHITFITAIWTAFVCVWLLINFRDWELSAWYIILCGICISTIWNGDFPRPFSPSVDENSSDSDIFVRYVTILIFYTALIYLSIGSISDSLKMYF